jgi:hypothetical protein
MASQADRSRPGEYSAEYVPGHGFRRLIAELLGEPPRTVWTPPAPALQPPAADSPDEPTVPSATTPRTAAPPAAPIAVDRLGLAWRGKFWILLATVIGGVGAYLGCSLLPPTYQSTATLRVVVQSGAGVSQDAVLASNDLAVQYAPLIRTGAVVGPAAVRMHESGSALSTAISSGTVGDQNLMAVTARGASEREAQRRANAVARQFVTYIRASNRQQVVSYTRLVGSTLAPIQSEIEILKSQLGRGAGSDIATGSSSSVNGAQATLATLLTARQSAAANLAQSVAASQPQIQLIAPAGPGTQVEPKPMLYALVTALAAFLVALQLVVVIGARRQAAGAR